MLNVTVRQGKHIELFYYNSNTHGNYWIECFSYQEGHNQCNIEYMRKCKPVDITSDTVKSFVERWSNFGPDKTEYRIVKRLTKPSIKKVQA